MHPKNSLDRVKQRTQLSILVTAACVFSTKLALADAPHYQVELATSLPECNRKADLLSILEPLLVEPMLEPPAQRTITMRITKKQTLYRVDLLVKELDGREIDSTYTEFPVAIGCFETLYRGALRAAVRMNQDVPPPADAAAPSAPACPPQPPAVPPCPACEQRALEPPKPASKERQWFIGAGGSVGFGVAPETVTGIQLLGGWRWAPSWSVELDARATFPQDMRPLGPTIARVYTVASVSVAPCYRVGPAGLCGLVNGTSAWASSIDAANQRLGAIPFFGIGGRAFLEHHLSIRWSFRVDADVLVPVLHMQAEEAEQPRWAPMPVTGSLGLSMLAWF